MEEIKSLFPEFFWEKQENNKVEEAIPNLTHPEDHAMFIAQQRLSLLVQEEDTPRKYVPPKKKQQGLLDIAKKVTKV